MTTPRILAPFSEESFCRDEVDGAWAGGADEPASRCELTRGGLWRLMRGLAGRWNLASRRRARAEAREQAWLDRIAELEREKAAGEEALLVRAVREAELMRARDAAEAANRAKGEFLAAMSHEIRTPMNGVLGLANLLQDSPLNPEQRELVRTLCRCGEGLLTLTGDLLDLSKIEAGRLALENIDFDLAEPLQLAIDLHAEAAARKGIQLIVDLDAAVPARVRGDPLRLRQVLLNLVGNAVKFTARGEVVLRVRFDRPRRGGSRLRLEVIDTGIGIAKSIQGSLFQPFMQADRSTTRRFGGTGLGLAICKRLVGLMRGEIGVSSTEGVGSVFWFTVELDHPLEPGVEPIAPPAARGAKLAG